MKTSIGINHVSLAAVFLAFSLQPLSFFCAVAQGTAFTYQGPPETIYANKHH